MQIHDRKGHSISRVKGVVGWNYEIKMRLDSRIGEYGFRNMVCKVCSNLIDYIGDPMITWSSPCSICQSAFTYAEETIYPFCGPNGLVNFNNTAFRLWLKCDD